LACVVFSFNPGSNRKEKKGARISGETEVAISPLKHENLNLIALTSTLLKPDSRMKALVQWAKLKAHLLPFRLCAALSLVVLQLQLEPHRQEIIPERHK
jgi:hypothetical protein